MAQNNPTLNRSSFFPFDETRSCKEIKDFYISASDIKTPKQNYIIAQAPIEATVHDFWKMILYKKCTLIVTACMPIESNHDRCTPYWKETYFPKKVLGWSLSFIEEKILEKGPKSQKIVARYFWAYNVKKYKKRKIVQLHLENWPDYSVPDFLLFQSFVDLVNEYSKNSSAPILVHCSAGVGRSGTFVTTHSLLKEQSDGVKEINVPQRIYDLRLQRASLVTTVKQFQFIYNTLLFRGKDMKSRED